MPNSITDLPENTLSLILSYVISPMLLLEGYCLLAVSKAMKASIQNFLSQEVSTYYFEKYRQSFFFRDISQFTLRMYYYLLGPKILLVGGIQENRKCEMFNIWSSKMCKVCSLSLKRTEDFDLINYHGFILVVSGSDDSAVSKTEIYNIFTNRWYNFVSLPLGLSAISTIIYNDELYVVGGVERQTSRRSTNIFKLQPLAKPPSSSSSSSASASATTITEEITTTLTTGFSASLTSLSGKHLAFPTLLQHDAVNEEFGEQFDWTMQNNATLSVGRSHHSCVVYLGNIWIVGGFISGQFTVSNSVEVLSLTSGQESLSMPSMLRQRFKPFLYVFEDTLYAIGGDMEGHTHSVCSIERYDVAKNTWMFVTFFPEPRRRSRCAIAAYDSKVYIFGGMDGGNMLSSWDYYDIQLHYWGSQMQSNIVDKINHHHIQHVLSDLDRQYLDHLNFRTLDNRSNGLKATQAATLVL